jgi:hypothetical protein
MLEDVYCGGIISSVLKVHCGDQDHAKSLLNCVQKHNLSTLLIKLSEDHINVIANAATAI